MATSRLAQRHVDILKPGRKIRDIRDEGTQGLRYRILPAGRKRYSLHSQVGGQRVWPSVTPWTSPWRARSKVNLGDHRNQTIVLVQGHADVGTWFGSLHASPVATDRSAPFPAVILRLGEVFSVSRAAVYLDMRRTAWSVMSH